MQASESNFIKNGRKWAVCKQIEARKCENNTELLNRRSYNEHKWSDRFINLLDGAVADDSSSPSDRASAEQNIQLFDAVFRNGETLLHANEQACACLPSKEFFQKSGLFLKASLPRDNMSVEVASQSEFASQTLKPFSTQNLAWIPFGDTSSSTKYKLKETSPGCLPTKKGKSKKLQRKGSGKSQQEFNESLKSNNNKTLSNNNREGNDGKLYDDSKPQRKSSFISSVIKFAKFGRKKKRVSEETQETSDDSNWGTESSDEKRDEDEEFIFGGVRVFFDENGEFCEVDDVHDSRSVSSYSSDNDSECDEPARRDRTKFESSDSLNLGYSGSFVS